MRFKRLLEKKCLVHGEGSCHMVLVGKTKHYPEAEVS